MVGDKPADTRAGSVNGPGYSPMRSIEFVLASKDSICPNRSYPGDCGYDLYIDREVLCPAGRVTDCPTGISMALPDGFWARITGRSSTFRKRGVLVVEGVIDEGYHGELYIGIFNPTPKDIQFEKHARLAQLIIHKTESLYWQNVPKLKGSIRGEKGFGSSGR